MADNYLFVPGYAVRPEHYGPDVFEQVSGIPWTDIQGLSRGWGTSFRGKQNVQTWFHFPITYPQMLNGKRMWCNLAGVTLSLEPANAFFQSMHLWDRRNRFFWIDNLNLTGNYGSTWTENINWFRFPDYQVNGAVGISVLVYFDDAGTVTFTGAGLRLHD